MAILRCLWVPREVYKLAENVACTIDGVSEGFWKLEKSDMVRLYIDGNKVVRIVGESKIRKTIGKLRIYSRR